MGSSVILPPAGQPKKGDDPSFKASALPNVVTFGFEKLGPPSPLYIQRDDLLAINVAASIAGITPIISGRLLLPYSSFKGQPDQEPSDPLSDPLVRLGSIIPFQLQLNPPGNRAFNGTFLPLQEGYLLAVSVGIPVGQTVKRGQVFINVGLQRNVASLFRDHELFADYVTPNMDIGWPGGRIIHSIESNGASLLQTVANPTAGADWTITVPAGARWRVQSWSALLTTSAAVANRVVRNIFQTAGITYFSGSPNQVIPASTAAQVTAVNSVPSAAASIVDVQVGLNSQMYARAGDTISSSTLNIQAADQWSGIRLLVEEWLEP